MLRENKTKLEATVILPDGQQRVGSLWLFTFLIISSAKVESSPDLLSYSMFSDVGEELLSQGTGSNLIPSQALYDPHTFSSFPMNIFVIRTTTHK